MNEPQRASQGRVLALLALLLGFVAGAVHLYSRGVFARDQIIDFDATRTELSLSFSIVTAVAALMAPPLGYLLDRYPIRRVMALGAAWLAAGFLLLTQATTLWQFTLLSAVFIGTGASAIGTSATTALMVNWFDRRRGLALGVAIAGYSTAGFVMGPVAVAMLERWGWRGSYVVFALVCLVVVLPLVLLLVRNRTPPQQPARMETQEPWHHGFVLLLRDPPFWRSTLVIGALSAGFVGLNVHMFLYLTDLGLPADLAGWVLSVEGLLALVAKPVCGWLIDRIGVRRSLALGVCAGVAALLLLPAIEGYTGALAACAFTGFAFGGIVPIQAALMSRLYGRERYARAYGALRLTTFPLTFAGSLVFGLAYDLSGGYEPGFYVAAALLALTLPVALRLHPRDDPPAGSAPQMQQATPVPRP